MNAATCQPKEKEEEDRQVEEEEGDMEKEACQMETAFVRWYHLLSD